jgi:hypothetical protein
MLKATSARLTVDVRRKAKMAAMQHHTTTPPFAASPKAHLEKEGQR